MRICTVIHIRRHMLKLSKGLFRYWPQLIGMFVAIIGQSMSSLFIPDIMGSIIDKGIIVTAEGAASVNVTYILTQGGYMLLLALISLGCAVAATFAAGYVQSKLGADIRANIFDKVQAFTSKEYGQFGEASLITRTTNDVTQIQNAVYMLLRFGLMIPFMFIGGIALSLKQSVKASSVLLVAIPVLIGLALILGIKVFKLFEQMQKRIDKLTLVMRETLSGVRVIRAFNREDSEFERFDNANSEVRKIGTKANRLMAYMFPSVMIIINVTILGVVLLISSDVKSGAIAGSEVGGMLAIIEYISQIMMSVVMVAMMFVMIPRASASASRINEVLDTDISITSDGTLTQFDTDTVEFDNVGYKYGNADKYVLQDITFTANRGDTIGIIGSTGSGKSTLMGLLPRMFDCVEGEIRIGGVNIKDIPLDTLRASIGYIPQKSTLFKGTIESNLKYGKQDATEEEMVEALSYAQAIDFVNNKEGGLQAEVEQGGANFSGGQKQRLSIARALVRKPPIYVFDDSFSALDNTTDLKLRTALKENVHDAITFIVASRIGTILNADEILVLDEGRLVARGKHKELLENCEIYREIAFSQLSEEELQNA